MRTNSRRQFLKRSLVAGAVGGTAADASRGSTALSFGAVAGANDRVRIALIGSGGMGRNDLRKMIRIKGVECIAVCDVDDEQAAKGVMSGK